MLQVQRRRPTDSNFLPASTFQRGVLVRRLAVAAQGARGLCCSRQRGGMPQRIHQRLPYRAASPRDFGSRYDDNRLNLEPDERQTHKDERRKQRDRRPWQQEQALNDSGLQRQHERQKEQEDSREQRQRDRETETATESPRQQQRQLHTQRSRRSSYRSPTESSMRSMRDAAQMQVHSTLQPSDSSLDSARLALRQKFLAASYTAQGTKLHDLFARCDRNHSGRLSFNEFSRAVRVEARTPEWKMDEAMLRALWSSMGGRLHDEISVAQCVHIVEQDWSPSQPQPQDQTLSESGPTQLSRSRHLDGRRTRKEAVDGTGVHDAEHSESEESYNGRHNAPPKDSTAHEPLDTVDNLADLNLSDSSRSEQNSGTHSRGRAQRSARRQVYSPGRQSPGQAHKTALAVTDSDGFAGDDEFEGDPDKGRRELAMAPHDDAANHAEGLVSQQEQAQAPEREREREPEPEPEPEPDRDRDHNHDHEETRDEGAEDSDFGPQAHQGGGSSGWRRKLVSMEREHAEHIAALQRKHRVLLEAVVKAGQEHTGVLSAHTNPVVQEEIARAIADPQTRKLMLEFEQQQDHEQQQQATVVAEQHDHAGRGEEVDVDDFLSPSARHELKQAWDAVDKTGDGYLDCDELRAVFDHVGPTYTDSQWQQTFAEIDVNGSGRVNIGEFQHWLSEYHVTKKARILSGKTEMLRDAITGGHGGKHAPVLFNGDSLAFATGNFEDSQRPHVQHPQHQHQPTVAERQLLQSAIASLPTLDPFNIPTDTALAVLLRKVVAGGSSRLFNATVTAEDEDTQVSFQQASRLCELVFPLTLGAAVVTAELARVFLVPTSQGGFVAQGSGSEGPRSQAHTEAASRQQIIAEHSAQYRAKMSRAFDGADWFGTRRLNGIWACRAMLYYFVWFDRAWASLFPLVTRDEDAHVSEKEFNAMVRGLRLPLSNEEANRSYKRLATVGQSCDGRTTGRETVTTDRVCRCVLLLWLSLRPFRNCCAASTSHLTSVLVLYRGRYSWVVRSCVAKEQGWSEPEELEMDRRKIKNKFERNQQQKPKIYNRQNRVSSTLSEERDTNHGAEQSSRGSAHAGVYKSTRLLGVRPSRAQQAAADAVERQQAGQSRRAAAIDVSGLLSIDLDQAGSQAPDTYDKLRKTGLVQLGDVQEPDVGWPNTQVDVEVPPLPSRIPPFLRRR